MNTNTSVIVFRKSNIKCTLEIRLGLVNRIGGATPKRFLGKELKEVGDILLRRGYKLNKILYNERLD